MGNRFIILISIILLLAGCTVPDKKETDLEKMKLHGKVKSVKAISYEAIDRFGEITKGEKCGGFLNWDSFDSYNEQGNFIDEIQYKSDGKILSTNEYKYNDKGYKVELISYFDSDSYISKKKTIYKYDNNGNMIESNELFLSDGSIYKKHIYKYDGNGYRIESTTYNSEASLETKVIYKNDENGNCTEIGVYDSIGIFTEKNTYIYDSKGNQTEYNNYNSAGKRISGYKIEYDSLGNKSEMNLFDVYNYPAGHRQTFKYDKQGNCIAGITFRNNDIAEDNYIYEYDMNNNWIKRIYFCNNKALYIKERTIKYYE